MRYANDIVLLSARAKNLQALQDGVVAKSEEKELKFNISKVKAIVISKNEELLANLSTDYPQVKQVSKF